MRITQIKQWLIQKCFRWLPEDQDELWKWSYTGRIMHPAWTLPNFEDQIEEATAGCYLVPIFSEEYCDWLIAQAEASQAWSFDRTDEYSAWEIPLEKLHHGFVDVYHKEIVIRQNLAERVLDGLFQWEPEGVEKAFLIKYIEGTCVKMDMHHDHNSIVSMSINLNDEFEGGELAFIRTPEDKASQRKGWAAIFSGGPTMSHQALPITKGVRYVLVYWIL